MWNRELCMRLPNSLVEGDAFHEHQLMLEAEIPAKFLGFLECIYYKVPEFGGPGLEWTQLGFVVLGESPEPSAGSSLGSQRGCGRVLGFGGSKVQP